MKSFAEKATLINEVNGVKKYEVIWYDAHGKRHLDMAEGKNMATALQTVLRQRVKAKLVKVPNEVYIVLYSVFMGTFGWAALGSNAPVLTFLVSISLLVTIKLVTDRYFRFVK